MLRRTKQPQLNTDYIMARNLPASHPPAGVLQQQEQYPWTDFQPANLQPVLPDQLQPTAYSTPVCSGTQATNTTAALTGAFQTLNPNTSFNLSDYIPTTPKAPPAPTRSEHLVNAQWTLSKWNILNSVILKVKCVVTCITCKLFWKMEINKKIQFLF